MFQYFPYSGWSNSILHVFPVWVVICKYLCICCICNIYLTCNVLLPSNSDHQNDIPNLFPLNMATSQGILKSLMSDFVKNAGVPSLGIHLDHWIPIQKKSTTSKSKLLVPPNFETHTHTQNKNTKTQKKHGMLVEKHPIIPSFFSRGLSVLIFLRILHVQKGILHRVDKLIFSTPRLYQHHPTKTEQFSTQTHGLQIYTSSFKLIQIHEQWNSFEKRHLTWLVYFIIILLAKVHN